MRKMSIIVVAMFAAACGPDVEQSCQNYIDNATACANEAFGGGTGTTTTTTGGTTGGLGSFCSAYDGLKGSEAKDAAGYLDCLSDAYANGDCSTAEGYTAAGTEAAGCVLGG